MRSKYFYSVLTALFLLIHLPISGSCADTWKTDNPADQDLNAIWGSTDEDIYAAGASNTLIHFDGSSWEQVLQIKNSTPTIDLMSVWGAPPVPVLCAGKQGIIFLNDGMRWLKFTLAKLTLSDINAIWGSSKTNIYAVGSLGTILSFNGTSWNLVTPAITSADLYCIWGSSADDIFVGGYLGNLFHYNGITWESLSLTSQDLRAIWGSSGSDVYVTGSDGDILHYNGSTWKTVSTKSGISLYTLWGSAVDDVFAAGENGKIFHYYDDGVSLGWHDITPSISINDIKAAWGSTSGIGIIWRIGLGFYYGVAVFSVAENICQSSVALERHARADPIPKDSAHHLPVAGAFYFFFDDTGHGQDIINGFTLARHIRFHLIGNFRIKSIKHPPHNVFRRNIFFKIKSVGKKKPLKCGYFRIIQVAVSSFEISRIIYDFQKSIAIKTVFGQSRRHLFGSPSFRKSNFYKT